MGRTRGVGYRPNPNPRYKDGVDLLKKITPPVSEDEDEDDSLDVFFAPREDDVAHCRTKHDAARTRGASRKGGSSRGGSSRRARGGKSQTACEPTPDIVLPDLPNPVIPPSSETPEPQSKGLPELVNPLPPLCIIPGSNLPDLPPPLPSVSYQDLIRACETARDPESPQSGDNFVHSASNHDDDGTMNDESENNEDADPPIDTESAPPADSHDASMGTADSTRPRRHARPFKPTPGGTRPIVTEWLGE